MHMGGVPGNRCVGKSSVSIEEGGYSGGVHWHREDEVVVEVRVRN